MLILMLTSNLFSQVTLDYNASTTELVSTNWDNSVTFNTGASGIQTFTLTYPTSPNNYVKYDNGVRFSTGVYSNGIESNSILQISPSSFNIDYTVNYQWILPSNNRDVKLMGSTDGVVYNVINSNIVSGSTYTFDNTISNYTFIKVRFTADGKNDVRLSSFSISSTGTLSIESTNISENYKVYSYNKNLVVKSNSFNDYTITLYNLNGGVVLSKVTNSNTETTLDVSNGMYIVNVNDGISSFNQKIIIQ